MALVAPQASRSLFLANILNKTAPQNLVLRLFTNNVTPASTDTAASYTEMTTQGYASVALTAASWTITDGTPSTGAYPQVTFTFNGIGGATNVYGYYLTETTSGLLKWAERFTDGPYNVTTNGDQIKVTLNVAEA